MLQEEKKNPILEDWANVQRILKYLKYTINYGIKFTKDKNLRIFVDADYAGDTDSKSLPLGFLIMIGSAPTCRNKKLLDQI